MTSALDWQGWWDLSHPPEPAVPSDPRAIAQEKCTGHSSKTGERCKRWPLRGSTVCTSHGAAAPQVREKAALRVQEQQALAQARRSAGDLDLGQFGDPFGALETALAHQHHLALRLLALVEQIPDGQLRYQGRISEQLRGEVVAAQRALADLRASAEGAMKLGLAERKVGLQQQSVALLDKALTAALAEAGISFDGIDAARATFRKHMQAIVIKGKVEDGSDSLRPPRPDGVLARQSLEVQHREARGVVR